MRGFVVNTIKQYNNARIEIESRFIGLRHAHTVMIGWLITRANPETGLVENITYADLTALLTVDTASGKKDSDAPQKQTIRSYLRTIEAKCGDDFKIVSDGQNLKITFLSLPEIYASNFESSNSYTDQYTVPYTPTPLINIEEKALFDRSSYTEEYTDSYTPEPVDAINTAAYAGAKIKIKNITNKQTNTGGESFADLKQPIDRDFYPNPETIELALAKGFVKVTSELEIKRFITYNLACSTRWADFNPIFINWLERDHNRDAEEKIATLTQHNLRTTHHEQRTTHQITGRKPTVADAIERNQRIIDEDNKRQANDFVEGEYFESVALPYCTVQQSVHQ